MERMRPPAVREQPVGIFSDDELRALLDTCRGNTFENRRDMAILRMLIDTGMRAGELAGLSLEDLDGEASVAFVMGKGCRGRAVPYGAKTADAAPVPPRPHTASPGRPHRVVAQEEGQGHRLRRSADPRAPGRRGRCRERPPAPPRRSGVQPWLP